MPRSKYHVPCSYQVMKEADRLELKDYNNLVKSFITRAEIKDPTKLRLHGVIIDGVEHNFPPKSCSAERFAEATAEVRKDNSYGVIDGFVVTCYAGMQMQAWIINLDLNHIGFTAIQLREQVA